MAFVGQHKMLKIPPVGCGVSDISGRDVGSPSGTMSYGSYYLNKIGLQVAFFDIFTPEYAARLITIRRPHSRDRALPFRTVATFGR